MDSSRTSSDQGTLGRLIARGSPAVLDFVGHELSLARLQERDGNGVVRFRGASYEYRYGPLPRWTGVRRGISSWLGRSALPGMDAFERLAWLRRHGLGAPKPAAAGVYVRRGVPQFSFFYKEEIEGAQDLREALRGASPEHRYAIARALAEELAELHLFGFVHGDLQPHNLLVTGTGDALAIHFDEPRHGLAPGHHITEDVAVLMLEGASLFEEAEQRILLGTYFGQRERSRPVNRRSEMLRIVRRRAAWASKEQARRTAADLPPIEPSWKPPFMKLGAA